MPRKSHVVGPATARDGVRTMAYRACQALVCAQCGGAILPDSLFSRRSQHVPWAAVGAVTTAPVCVTCRPLRVDGVTEATETTEAPAPTCEEQHEG